MPSKAQNPISRFPTGKVPNILRIWKLRKGFSKGIFRQKIPPRMGLKLECIHLYQVLLRGDE
jgi:hypothetical protein